VSLNCNPPGERWSISPAFAIHPQNLTLLTLLQIVDGLDLSLKELFLDIE